MNSLFNSGNEVFASFVFYGALALGKTALMSMVTSFYRSKHQSVPSIEDARMMAPGDEAKQKLMLKPNEEVERVNK